MSDRVSYLTVSQAYDLNFACQALTAAGFHAYQVGSSLTRKDWRDVDLRVLLEDSDFDTLFGRPDTDRHALLNVAISEWLSARTGLPVDFQFQRRTDANSKFDGPRLFMGVPFRKPCDAFESL